MLWGPRCYRGKDPGHPHCKERLTEARKGGAATKPAALGSTSSPASPTAVRGHLWSVPSPAHRQDGDLALASSLGPGLGGPGWVGQESGSRSGGSCGLRGQQHLGPLLLATTGAAGACFEHFTCTAGNTHNKLDVVSITTPVLQMRKQRFNVKIYSPEDMANEWMKMNSASSSESLS